MDLALKLATLIGVLLAAASILHASMINRRQMNAQIFLEYTRRYEAVMKRDRIPLWATWPQLPTWLGYSPKGG